MSEPDERPEILDTETEREILYQRACDRARTALSALQPDLTVRDGDDVIAGMAVTGFLNALRVMSGRQLAVLLACEANPGIGYVIREPPRYTEAENRRESGHE